jgi:hypothetical protein
MSWSAGRRRHTKQLLPQLPAIGLARCPSLTQIGVVRIQFALKARIRRPFRKARDLEIAADSRAGDLQALSNLLLQCPSLMEREHLLILCQTPLPPLLLHLLAIRVACALEIWQRQGCVRRVIIT